MPSGSSWKSSDTGRVLDYRMAEGSPGFIVRAFVDSSLWWYNVKKA